MLLLVDNYDSFTYNLVDYFNQIGVESEVVRNDVHPSKIRDINKFVGLVLSPGPGRPEDAGFLMEYIQYFENKMPILGICLGHQAIALFYGGQVVKAIKPMHGKLSTVCRSIDDNIYLDIPQRFEVVRYHSLVAMINHSNQLLNLAETKEGELMILKHRAKMIYGIQYHPEAVLTQFGLQILNNWVQIIRKKSELEFFSSKRIK